MKINFRLAIKPYLVIKFNDCDGYGVLERDTGELMPKDGHYILPEPWAHQYARQLNKGEQRR